MLASIYRVYSSCTFHLKQRILVEDALAFVVAFLRCGCLQRFTVYHRVCVRIDLMFASASTKHVALAYSSLVKLQHDTDIGSYWTL